MGLVTVDNRESGGKLVERTTETCHGCGAIIEYESRPLGNFHRRFRVHKRRLPNGDIQSRETAAGDYVCNQHNKILCIWCAEKARYTGRCVSMEQVADATVTALAKKVDVWSHDGRLFIERLLERRVF